MLLQYKKDDCLVLILYVILYGCFHCKIAYLYTRCN
uniref:Uncharacterized protein n=1 Tax=Anguilla anguilla TaxID=7936 RepID=A0A0E9VID2_ANGAN